jgi:hypothetical protein
MSRPSIDDIHAEHDLDAVTTQTTYDGRSNDPCHCGSSEITAATTTRSETAPVIGDRWTPDEIYRLLWRVFSSSTVATMHVGVGTATRIGALVGHAETSILVLLWNHK